MLPEALLKLTQGLTQDLTGSEVYLVGGAVRDLLLGRETKDYDLVVRGVEAKKLEQWLAKSGTVSLVGKTFGVFKWQPESWAGEVIDVALPRTEHVVQGTGQYRDFEVQSDTTLSIEVDLSRRDFTINALALNLASGELVDPYNGRVDLEQKAIRTVGKPEARFTEDLSRTLRALRFACQLGFTIEEQTWAVLKAKAERTALGKHSDDFLVPREVMARELLKALVSNPKRALELLDESGFLPHLLPEVVAMKGCPQPPQFHSEGDVFQHTKLALAALASPSWQEFFGSAKPSLNTVVATLLHDIGKPLTLKTPERDGVDRIRTNDHDTAGANLVPKVCERLKLSSYVDPERGQVEPEVVTWLVQHHLILVHGKPEALKPSTIYRYFLKDAPRGLALQQLIFADASASWPEQGKPSAELLERLRARLPEIEAKLTTGKLQLLMSGDDIMKAFSLSPGPKVGELLQALEEAQLEGTVKTAEQAKDFLHTKL